jgi:hypothetical protein
MAHERSITPKWLQPFRDCALDLGDAFIGTVDGVYPIMRVDDGYFECPYCGGLHRARVAPGRWTHVTCKVLPIFVRNCGVFLVENRDQADSIDGFEPTPLADWVEWRASACDRRSA